MSEIDIQEFEVEKSELEKQLKLTTEKYKKIKQECFDIYVEYQKNNPRYWVPFDYFKLYLHESRLLKDLSEDTAIKTILTKYNQPIDSGLNLVKLTKIILEYQNKIKNYTSRLKVVENSLKNHLKYYDLKKEMKG